MMSACLCKSDPIDLANRLALRPAEAARVLGVSERTLRTMLAHEDLPHIRVRGVLLIPVEALKEWLRQRTEEERRQTDAIATEILKAVQPT